MEMKFQVSLKAKIMQDAFGKGDVWVAFTQQAYWQMYNGKLSRLLGKSTMSQSLSLPIL
jgi:phospholipase